MRVRASVKGDAAESFERLSGRLGPELDRSLSELGERAELIYASFALHGATGRLSRGISSQAVGGRVIVRADARDPATGFDYVGVTRFGHRSLRIVPRADRGTATVVATRRGREPGKGSQSALRFVIGGRVLYRKSVRGFHPAQDWAARAFPAIEREAREVMTRLGRRIGVFQ